MQFLSFFRKNLVAWNFEEVQQGTMSLTGRLLVRNKRSFPTKKAQNVIKNEKNSKMYQFSSFYTFLSNFQEMS